MAPRSLLPLLLLCCFAAPSRIPADELARLELALDRSHYLQLAQNNVYLKATIHTGGPDNAAERPRLNLAVALDRSGSMEGDKLEQAKKAMHQTLSQLSSHDFFTLVTYGSEVEIAIPATAADKLAISEPAIENLLPEGGSALFEGLNQAAAQLRRQATSRTTNRIVLISDGEANKGPREPEEFAKLAAQLATEGISISAIGLGEDYHAETLYRLASASGGTLRSVRNPAELTQAVSEEIARLTEAIAKNAVLTIEFEGSTEIEESLGRPAEVFRNAAVFRFDHLYAYQELAVVVQATVPASQSLAGSSRVARATLAYTPISETPSAATRELTAAVSARFADSARVSHRSIDTSVLRTVCALEIAGSIREAFADFDAGRETQALVNLRRTARDLRIVNSNFPDLRIDQQLEELGAAIRTIEERGIEAIDRKALTSTLYQRTHRGSTTSASEPSNAK